MLLIEIFCSYDSKYSMSIDKTVLYGYNSIEKTV